VGIEPPERELILRPFRAEDRAPALIAHEALKADDFAFLLSYTDGEPWSAWLERVEAERKGDVPPDRVPATFLAAIVNGELVGRVSVRHQLNDWLAAYGGHIGYAVVPWQRRQGYATEILRQALVIARGVGVEDVLIFCDTSNVASARTIEACGGRFESETDGPDGGEPLRRYWIQ
jgi:predicted acetyltransferase